MSERVRVILDCNWGDLPHALDMLRDLKPAFDSRPSRPGWGWNKWRRGHPEMFVRQTKSGFPVTDVSTPNDNPNGEK